MPNRVNELAAQLLRRPDRRTVEQWVHDERIQPPGSKWGTQMDLALTPHLIEPAQAIADNHNREVVLLMPTGAGKTTVLDASVLRAVKEDPGSILLAMQNDADADAYWDERLEPMLLNLGGVGAMIRSLPRGKRRKGEFILPHLTLYCQGANIANFQRKSVRYVFLDEAWQIGHGLIAEARGRHHDRWNARVVIVSQGGWQNIDTSSGRMQTELYAAWQRSDRREWCYTCPECNTVQQWKWRQLKWEDVKKHDGTFDEPAIAQSTYYECANCETRFDDKVTVRRQLAMSGSYEPTNAEPLRIPGNHVGFHCNCLAIYDVPWGARVVEWMAASHAKAAGDLSPIRVFLQKRLADFWLDEEDAPGVLLGGAGYSVTEYMESQAWDGELYRFFTLDRQRDHWWGVIRSWKPDGSSRLLWAGKILTVENARAMQHQYKVIDDFTFQDAQYETGSVYDDGVRYGWVSLHGTQERGFPHPRINRPPLDKMFSRLKVARSPSGGSARYILWASDPVKDELAKHRAGRKAPWQVPDDRGEDYDVQINAEVKKDVINKTTKQVVQRWVRIGSRPNHIWDCEAMQIVAALIKGVIKDEGAEAVKAAE